MIGTQRILNQSKSIVKFHDPYSRLNQRAKIDHIIQNNPKFHQLLSIDLAPLLDAVIKRGGPQRILPRLQEVILSLPYYDINLIKKSVQIVSPISKQPQFMGIISQIQYIGQPFVQQHLLPATSGQGYYQLTAQQSIFARQNFSHIDQYLTIKTLAYFGAIPIKLNKLYVDRYYKLRRWLYINDIIINIPDEQLAIINKQFQLKQHPSIYKQMNMMGVNNLHIYPRICIVGITLANVIMGIKLSRLGYYVKIVERSYENLYKWSAGFIPDLIKQGVYLNNQLQAKRFNEVLSNYFGVSTQTFDNISVGDMQQNSRKNQVKNEVKDPLFRYEQTFILLFEQILAQYPGNALKQLWQQLYSKIMSINNNLEYRSRNRSRISERVDIDGIRMYFQRFIMLNKIKDQQIVTVGDIKRFVEQYYMLVQPVTLYNKLVYRNNKIKMSISNTIYILKPEKIKVKKYQELISKDKVANSNINLTICVDSLVKKIQYKQNMWHIAMTNIKDNKIFLQQFTHLIYSQPQSLQKSFRQRFFLPELANPIHFPVFQQFNYHSEVHCLYKFTQTVQFRGTNTYKYMYNYYCSQIGTIHFYILPSKYQILACIRKSIKYSSVDYYKEIYNILYDHLLKNNPKIEYPKQNANFYIENCRYFSLKDDKNLQSVIKLREKQNMYLSVPIICMYGDHSKNIIQSQMKINNKIISYILHNHNQYLRRLENVHHAQLIPLQIPLGQQLPIPYNPIPSYIPPINHVIGNLAIPIGNMKSVNVLAPTIPMNPYHIGMYSQQGNKGIIKNSNEEEILSEGKKVSELKQAQKKVDEMQGQSDKNISKEKDNTQITNLNKKEHFFGMDCQLVKKIRWILHTSILDIYRFMSSLSIGHLNTNNKLSLNIPYFVIDFPLPISNCGYFSTPGLPRLSDLSSDYQQILFMNMVILNISKSIIDDSKQAILYSTCIVYNNIPLYCVLQIIYQNDVNWCVNEGILDVFIMFHINRQQLNCTINQIKGNNQKMNNLEQKNIKQYYKICKYKYILPGIIRKAINIQLDKQTQKMEQKYIDKCTHILNKKKLQINNKKQQKQQHSMKQQSYNNELITKISYNRKDIVNFIYQQANMLVIYFCQLFRLKTYTIADVFMGKINLIYIMAELTGIFQANNTQQYTNQSSQTIKIIKQQINSKQCSFPLKIYKQLNDIRIGRRFIRINEEEYQYINYKLSPEDVNPYPTTTKNRSNRNDRWLKQIIQKILSASYPIDKLMENLSILIRQQLEQISTILNLSSSSIQSHRNIFNYFAITRMKFKNNPLYEIPKQKIQQMYERSMDRLKKIKQQEYSQYSTQEQLDQISNMINQGNIIIDGNQILTCFYSSS